MKTKNRKTIIIEALENLEFICGLKQIRDYSKEDLLRLVDGLESFCSKIQWLSNGRLETILQKGMRGEYGQFYHINEMTLSGWVKSYFESNKQVIIKEIAYNEKETEISEEEKAYWMQLGKERFITLFEKAKTTGLIDGLGVDGFPPYWISKLANTGVLRLENYNMDEYKDKAKKMLRIQGLDYSDSVLQAKANEVIWKEFIKECIDNEIDLTKMI
jgi:hypothetical protein